MCNERIRKLPHVKRARDYYLYCTDGKRYLDLFQNNGRAVLGHRPERLSTTLKNEISKGVYADYPSVYERRVVKAIGSLLPEYPVVKIFSNFDRALCILNILEKDLHDPVTASDFEARPAAFWRPFIPRQEANCNVLFPVLPFPGSNIPQIVCFKETENSSLPESDIVSPILLAALIRCIADIRLFSKKIESAVWKPFEGGPWRRTGPYLVFTYSPDVYGRVFDTYLEHGFLIAPGHRAPTIAPSIYSEGELKKYKKITEKVRSDFHGS
jgi:hypothetical protein